MAETPEFWASSLSARSRAEPPGGGQRKSSRSVSLWVDTGHVGFTVLVCVVRHLPRLTQSFRRDSLSIERCGSHRGPICHVHTGVWPPTPSWATCAHLCICPEALQNPLRRQHVSVSFSCAERTARSPPWNRCASDELPQVPCTQQGLEPSPPVSLTLGACWLVTPAPGTHAPPAPVTLTAADPAWKRGAL